MTTVPFVAIDPGFAKSNGTGWAVFVHGTAVQLGVATSSLDGLVARAREIRGQMPHFYGTIPLGRRVIEHMRVYPGPQQKGDQNDLLNLAFLEGLLSADVAESILIEAREWKGTVPKKVMQDRILKPGRLATQEAALVRALKGTAEQRGSAIEALGLGLWYVGRIGG